MRFCVLPLSLVLAGGILNPSWAVYGVRISDLTNSPTPPNPMRVWGRVTSESPLKLSDGRGEITVTGRTATLEEFLVLDGHWNGQFFSVFQSEMIYIAAGSFLMGNNGAEPYSRCQELPQRPVYLSGYWIGKYEVTRGEYQQFMDAGGYSNPAHWSSAGWSWKVSSGRTEPAYWAASQDWGTGTFTQTANHPVVGVSYYEAEAFCNWAGGHLPTEAQWEKAARWTGSYPNVYPWGNTWDAEKCNNYYDHNAAGGGYQKYQTSPVGSYPSGVSPYGLHDMAGNVWEWGQDWYVTYPGCTCPVDYTGISRVLRGGSWSSYNFYPDGFGGRCSYRATNYPSYDSIIFGFRLAR